jgi:hypothetical protein
MRIIGDDPAQFDVATVTSGHQEFVASGQLEPLPMLDRVGCVSLVGGGLIILITFFTSYSHVDLFGIQLRVNQQVGIPLLLAALAALVGEIKLASDNRCADQRAREREARARGREARARSREAGARSREALEAARERDRAAQREQRQNRALRAGALVLLDPSPLNRRFLAYVAAELALPLV